MAVDPLSSPTNLDAALQAYNKGQGSDPLVKDLQFMQLPLTQQTTQFLQDELDMETASGNTAMWDGFYLPPQDSRHDFFQLVSWSEQYAGLTGWQYFLTPVQLQWGVEHGMVGQGQDAFNAWASSLSPTVSQNMPWASLGLKQPDYIQRQQSVQDIIATYTGDRNADPNLVQAAVTGRWTSQQVQDYILNNTNNQYGQWFPWTKYGMTYQQWQQYQITQGQSARDIVQQYMGDRYAMESLVGQATSEHWTSEQIQEAILNDPHALSVAPWMKFPQTRNYQSWLDFQTTNKQAATERFGSQGLTQENFLTMLSTPLESFHAQGGTVQQQDRKQANVGASEVR